MTSWKVASLLSVGWIAAVIGTGYVQTDIVLTGKLSHAQESAISYVCGSAVTTGIMIIWIATFYRRFLQDRNLGLGRWKFVLICSIIWAASIIAGLIIRPVAFAALETAKVFQNGDFDHATLTTAALTCGWTLLFMSDYTKQRMKS